MTKKVKINGSWVEMKDEDVQEVDTTADAPKEDAPAEDAPAEGTDEVEVEAKKIAKKIAKDVVSEMNVGDVSKLQNTVDALMKHISPEDSKLRSILGGKDMFIDKNELTKEEKIVGFFHALVTRNEIALKALSEGTDADGGYLFPNEFLKELIEDLPEINVMRNWVRIIPMKRNAMDITELISDPKVTWTGENVAKSTTTAHFGRQTLTAYKLAAILYSSDELIDDSDIFDVVALIIRKFSEAIAEEEERVIWAGDGTTQPQGIETSRAASGIASIAASGQDFNDVLTLFHALPRKYRTNAAFFMNDTTALNVSKLQDSNGQYLWQPSTTDGQPDRVRGKAVIISDWVPDNTIFFMDGKRTYFLGDRQRMTVKISQDTTQAFTQDMTAIRVVSRIGGKVVQGAAARALTGF